MLSPAGEDGGAAEGALLEADRDGDRAGGGVVERGGLPPAVPGQEPGRLLQPQGAVVTRPQKVSSGSPVRVLENACGLWLRFWNAFVLGT